MAYLQRGGSPEDEQELLQNSAGTSAQPMLAGQSALAGASTGSGTSNPAAASSQTASAPAGGVGGPHFANLSKYLDANQGGTGALADSIAKGVTDKANAASSAYDTAVSDLKSDVNSAVSKAKDNGTGDPEQGSHQYAGPDSIEGEASYQDAKTKAADAESAGKDLADQSKRAGLIEGATGRQKSNGVGASGKTLLDSFLLTSDPTAASKLNSASLQATSQLDAKDAQARAAALAAIQAGRYAASGQTPPQTPPVYSPPQSPDSAYAALNNYLARTRRG